MNAYELLKVVLAVVVAALGIAMWIYDAIENRKPVWDQKSPADRLEGWWTKRFASHPRTPHEQEH